MHLRLDSWRTQKVAEAKLSVVRGAQADNEARQREQDREDLEAHRLSVCRNDAAAMYGHSFAL